ncbi:hypothetical protein COP2_007835 [Malus domestica]
MHQQDHQIFQLIGYTKGLEIRALKGLFQRSLSPSFRGTIQRPHVSIGDTTIEDYFIPKGSHVILLEVVENLLVRCAKVVNIGFSEGGTKKLDAGSGAVRRDVEALPLEERVSLHALVLVRRTHHGVPKLHG